MPEKEYDPRSYQKPAGSNIFTVSVPEYSDKADAARGHAALADMRATKIYDVHVIPVNYDEPNFQEFY